MVELSSVALAVILALVTLFIGLYTINTVADLQDMDSLYDYTYTITRNDSTVEAINISVSKQYDLEIGFLDNTITGETSERTVVVIVNNTGVLAKTVNVSLNDPTMASGTSIGTLTASANSNSSKTFANVNFVGNVMNNITIGGNFLGDNVTVLEITTKYPSGNSTTGFYDIQQDLTDSTGTTFEVLILVMIIVALGIAIAVLKGGLVTGKTVSAV